MENKLKLQKSIKKAILKLKNGSASSEEISEEFASAIDQYMKQAIKKKSAG